MNTISGTALSFEDWLRVRLGPAYDVDYITYADEFSVLHKFDFMLQDQVFIRKDKLAHILATSSGNGDEEQKRLMEYFWGITQPADLPRGQDTEFRSKEGCSHDWHEVILFMTPQLRCKWCDIKKSDAGDAK